MLRIKSPNEVPQGGYRITRDFGPPTDDTSAYIWGGDLRTLVNEVLKYRVANNLDIVDIDARIQDWFCHNVPVECVAANAPRRKGPLAIGRMVLTFLYAMTQWMARGESSGQEEAEERALRCVSCIHNVEADAECFGCSGILSKIANIVGEKKTRVDSSLRFCGICGCSGKVQVWTPMDILARIHNPADFPSDIGDGKTPCWKKEWANKNALPN